MSFDSKQRKNLLYRLASLPLFLVCASILTLSHKGGREHFFEELPNTILSFAKFGAFLLSVTILRWALIRVGLSRGWTTEERLRSEQEVDARVQRHSFKAALLFFVLGMVVPMSLLWLFLNPIPGKPGLVTLDMARIESAYWIMGLSEVVAVFIVIKLGLRWVHSKLGKTIHMVFSLVCPISFLIVYLFDRSEPNVVLVLWAMTITLFPALYLLVVYQSNLRRKFRKDIGSC